MIGGGGSPSAVVDLSAAPVFGHPMSPPAILAGCGSGHSRVRESFGLGIYREDRHDLFPEKTLKCRTFSSSSG